MKKTATMPITHWDYCYCRRRLCCCCCCCCCCFCCSSACYLL